MRPRRPPPGVAPRAELRPQLPEAGRTLPFGRCPGPPQELGAARRGSPLFELMTLSKKPSPRLAPPARPAPWPQGRPLPPPCGIWGREMPSGTEPAQGWGCGTALSPESQLGTFGGRSACPARREPPPHAGRRAGLAACPARPFSALARPPRLRQPASRSWARFLRGPAALGQVAAGTQASLRGDEGVPQQQRWALGKDSEGTPDMLGPCAWRGSEGVRLVPGGAARRPRALAALGLRVLQAAPSACEPRSRLASHSAAGRGLASRTALQRWVAVTPPCPRCHQWAKGE